MRPNNPYLDMHYVDRTDEIESLYEPTLEDIKRDPHFYAELVNDLMFHWMFGTKETRTMIVARKAVLMRIFKDQYKYE
jgi:hypothetical protein